MNWLESTRKQFSWKFLNILTLGIMANVLFFGHGVGWTLGLFACLLLGTFLLHHKKPVTRLSGIIAVLMMLGLSISLINQPFWLPVILIIIGFATLTVLSHKNILTDTLLWAKGSFLAILVGWMSVPRDLKILMFARKTIGKPVFQIGAIIPILLGLLFVQLFSMANPVIHQWLANVDWHFATDFLNPLRILFFVTTTWVIWSLLRPFRISQWLLRDVKTSISMPEWLGSPLIRQSLLLFNLLFLVQNGMDAIYLWGLGGFSLPEGMSFAEYAHRGAYPLILTALLAGGFVFVTLRPGSATESDKTIRTMVTAWILQNILLTGSAVMRTLLYIEQYSLTHLRVAALIWMGLVALGLFWLLCRILAKRSHRWLLNVNTLTLLLVLYGCCFVDFNGIIAWYNVLHSREVTGQGQPLDIYYFEEQLGVSAIPALKWFEKKAPEVFQARYTRQRLSQQLQSEMTDWHQWTWHNQRIVDTLKGQEE